MSTQGISLKPFNTFALPARANHLTIADSVETLQQTWLQAQTSQQPLLLLGEGSNLLFLEDFAGIVMVNRIRGIDLMEDEHAWHLHVGAGENWHALVCHTLKLGIAGLENLALIPGCVGSAPIQNIGAYGVELERVCAYVDLLNMRNGEITRLAATECQFGYRESIFKHQYREGYAIVAVGLRLAKPWVPILSYGDLVQLDPQTVTPQQVFDSVCAMRRSKLPDPKTTGNAGSFFKNPIVDEATAQAIVTQYPRAPCYPQPEGGVKLAAGWLIDQCGLKGYQSGGAAVHQYQALVLINQHNASSQDVVVVARYVRQRVAEKFNVWLEPEVRFIGAMGEVSATETLS